MEGRLHHPKFLKKESYHLSNRQALLLIEIL